MARATCQVTGRLHTSWARRITFWPDTRRDEGSPSLSAPRPWEVVSSGVGPVGQRRASLPIDVAGSTHI